MLYVLSQFLVVSAHRVHVDYYVYGCTQHGPSAYGRDAQEQGQFPSTEALQRPLGAASRGAPYYGRRCLHAATLGAAKRHRKLPCQSALAHSTAPVGRRLREGSEGPLLREAGLPPGRLGHGQAAHATTHPDLSRFSRLARTKELSLIHI
eukprot:15439914-Alexandrium_andersonii.AAC.1